MNDGTVSTIVGLVVGMLATSIAAVVVSRTRERKRRGDTQGEAVAVPGARLRAQLRVLEIQARQLRAEIEMLSGQRAELVAAVAAPAPRGDPSPALAEGALRRARAHPHEELTRRLARAGDARVIPFPFLASQD